MGIGDCVGFCSFQSKVPVRLFQMRQEASSTQPVATWSCDTATLGVAVWSLPTIFDLNDQDDDDMTIRVAGQQWWWQFEYDLDEDGVFETITSGDIVFPAGETINLEITSNDVIHSFWIPELNGKRDAVPGRVHPWKIQ